MFYKSWPGRRTLESLNSWTCVSTDRLVLGGRGDDAAVGVAGEALLGEVLSAVGAPIADTLGSLRKPARGCE
eukprot:6424629-Alexandrium_andersonii.AAC.1